MFDTEETKLTHYCELWGDRVLVLRDYPAFSFIETYATIDY